MIYILNVLIISLFCAGLKQATEKGMLLFPVAQWWDRFTEIGTKQSWLFTITLGCVYCFASFWGTILYWNLMAFVWQADNGIATLIMWPVTCVCCVFTNGLFYWILKKYEAIN